MLFAARSPDNGLIYPNGDHYRAISRNIYLTFGPTFCVNQSWNKRWPDSRYHLWTG